jgi:DNA-binding IclR family transcriptional regulator
MNTHPAVEKALDILSAFIPHNQAMGTVEISEKLGFHKSTCNRLLHLLTRKGFLQQNPKTKKFQLGPSAMNLGTAIKRSLETDLVHIAQPYMDQLRDALDETVALEIFSGTNTVLACLALGSHRTNLAGNVGDILAVHAAAGAKAILAFSSPKVRQRVLSGKLPRLTANTITDPRRLEEQIQDILRNGVAFDIEEHDIGTSAMGAPIFSSEGKPVAALVVVGPVQRIRPQNDSPVAVRLKEIAAEISRRLFYNPLQHENK